MLAPNTEPTVASVFAPRAAFGPDGTVEGYASLFGEIDQARDKVVKGAFRETLLRRSVRRVPMLFQHDPSEPVGTGSTCARTSAACSRAENSFPTWRAPVNCSRCCEPAPSTACRSAFAP